MTHVQAEFDVVRKMLGDLERRRTELGPRIAARDLENCLEDVVSIFEAVLKAFVRRHLQHQGKTEEEIENILQKRIRNAFQNIERAKEATLEHLGQELFAGSQEDDIGNLRAIFEKRHPITHNLGVVDRKYMERIMQDEEEGREVRVSQEEITEAMDLCLGALRLLHSKLFLGDGDDS